MAAGVFGAVLLVGAVWSLVCGDCRRDAVPAAPIAGSPSSAAAGAPVPIRPAWGGAPASPTSATRAIGQLERALFIQGSLKGTTAPPWGVGRDQALKPNRALRDRFDYYLLGMTEASLDELSALARAHAEQDLGPRTSAEVMQVWARYLRLQQHAYAVVARPDDAMSMQAALQERHQTRQGILGMHWAQAFYGPEEEQLALDIEQKANGVKSERDGPPALMMAPASGTDPRVLQQQRSAKFGAEAARRLADLDREELDWNRRIEAANAKVHALKSAPELSDSQRDAAIRRYLDETFENPTERLRAGGLVGE